MADGIELHYAEHALADEGDFVDFHITVGQSGGLRRWIGRQVIFHVDGRSLFAPLPGDQGFPMLEWGMNWCVTTSCHQYLILHAAVLEREGHALILPAPSGSGKSTLCAGLVFRGWRLLSDELTLIDPVTMMIQPLPRPISLKNASINVIRSFAPEAKFNAVVHETTKGSIAHARPPANAVRRDRERALPGWIVLPQYQAGASSQLQPLPKGQAVMKLIENAFNYNVHAGQGFDTLTALVDKSDCYTFSYGQLDDACRVFDELALARRAA